MNHLVHKHLIVRAEIGYCPEDKQWVHDWLVNLVDVIGMKILAGPFIAEVTEIVGNLGITGVVIIETSHLAIHLWSETGLLQLDVYTCGPFDMGDIFDELQDFEPTKIEYKFLDREHGLTEI